MDINRDLSGRVVTDIHASSIRDAHTTVVKLEETVSSFTTRIHNEHMDTLQCLWSSVKKLFYILAEPSHLLATVVRTSVYIKYKLYWFMQ